MQYNLDLPSGSRDGKRDGCVWSRYDFRFGQNCHWVLHLGISRSFEVGGVTLSFLGNHAKSFLFHLSIGVEEERVHLGLSVYFCTVMSPMAGLGRRSQNSVWSTTIIIIIVISSQA